MSRQKIVEEDAIRIRALARSGVKVDSIAAEYGLRTQSVYRIVHYFQWKGIPWWAEWEIYRDGRAYP